LLFTHKKLWLVRVNLNLNSNILSMHVKLVYISNPNIHDIQWNLIFPFSVKWTIRNWHLHHWAVKYDTWQWKVRFSCGNCMFWENEYLLLKVIINWAGSEYKGCKILRYYFWLKLLDVEVILWYSHYHLLGHLLFLSISPRVLYFNYIIFCTR
jgi:hypothetical protein